MQLKFGICMYTTYSEAHVREERLHLSGFHSKELVRKTHKAEKSRGTNIHPAAARTAVVLFAGLACLCCLYIKLLLQTTTTNLTHA